jgi:hypothetical protein
MSMDDSNAFDSAQVSLIQKFVDTFSGLIGGQSDDLELARKVLIRIRPVIDSGGDLGPACRRGCGWPQRLQIIPLGPEFKNTNHYRVVVP